MNNSTSVYDDNKVITMALFPVVVMASFLFILCIAVLKASTINYFSSLSLMMLFALLILSCSISALVIDKVYEDSRNVWRLFDLLMVAFASAPILINVYGITYAMINKSFIVYLSPRLDSMSELYVKLSANELTIREMRELASQLSLSAECETFTAVGILYESIFVEALCGGSEPYLVNVFNQYLAQGVGVSVLLVIALALFIVYKQKH